MSAYETPYDSSMFEAKRADLVRMKRIATLLLGAVLVLLAISIVLSSSYPAFSWLRAFAEAATAGAIADWFAVVALFRRPLGLPIPHTGIIPRNKDRIGRSLGRFVEHNFLTPANIVRKLRQREISKEVSAWLAAPGNSGKVAERICSSIPPVLEALDDEDVQRWIENAVTPQLDRFDASSALARLLELLTAGGRHQTLLDAALKSAAQWVTVNRDFLVEKFGEVSKFTPELIDRYIVNRMIAGLIDLSEQVAQNPTHPLRLQFDEATARFIGNLRSSPDYRAHVEGLKQELLAHVKSERYYGALWAEARSKIVRDLQRPNSLIRSQLEEIIVRFAATLQQDAPLQQKLDGWLVRGVERFAVQHGAQISLLIEEIVRGWDAEDVARKTELEIGKDLQYIRINGMVVGGLVGLILHAFGKLL